MTWQQWFPNLEKSILDQLGQFIQQNKYTCNAQEQKCIDRYDQQAVKYGLMNVLAWGGIAQYTFRKPLPVWLKLYGVVGMTGGALVTVWLSSKYAARNCLQCVLDGEDKKRDMYLQCRQLLKTYHPNAEKFFAKEKYRLYVMTE